MENNKHLVTELLKEERLKKKYNCAICEEKTKRLIGYAYQGGQIYECDNSECPLNKLSKSTIKRHIIDLYLIPNKQTMSDKMKTVVQEVLSEKFKFATGQTSLIQIHMDDEHVSIETEMRHPDIKERREFVLSRLRYMYFSKKYGMTYEQYKSAQGQIRRDEISVIRFIDNLYYRNRENKYFSHDFAEFTSTKRLYAIVRKKVLFPTPFTSYVIDLSMEDKEN